MTRTLQRCLYLLAGIILPYALWSQSSGSQPLSLSLSQAKDYALQNNLNAKNSALDVEIAKKKIWETTAIGLPQLSGSANYQHIFKVPEMSFGGTVLSKTRTPNTLYGLPVAGDTVFVNTYSSDPIKLGVKDNITYDITLTQLIFSGEYLVGLQASKTYAQMAQQNKEKTQEDIKEAVTNLYYALLLVTENRKILVSTLENQKKFLGDTRQMVAAGFREETDADQLEIVASNLQNTISVIDRQSDYLQGMLKNMMGMPVETQIQLTDRVDALVTSALLATNNKPFSLENNTTYKLLTTGIDLANLSLKREKSTCLPSLMGVYRHTGKVNQPQFDFTVPDVVQMTLNVPLFASGQRNVKIQQRQMELQKAINNRDFVGENLKLDHQNATNDLQTQIDLMNTQKRNIDLAQRLLDKTMVKMKEGLSSSLDVTMIQNQYLTAQKDYLSAVLNMLTAKTKLEKLLHQL